MLFLNVPARQPAHYLANLSFYLYIHLLAIPPDTTFEMYFSLCQEESMLVNPTDIGYSNREEWGNESKGIPKEFAEAFPVLLKKYDSKILKIEKSKGH